MNTDSESSVGSIPPAGEIMTWAALILETTGIVFVGVIAGFMRFYPVSPVRQEWANYCSNSSSDLYSKTPGSDQSALFYSISIAIPVIVIVTMEVEKCSFPVNSHLKYLSVIERIADSSSLMFRVFGMYILGILLTSTLIDYLKITVGQPRPYLLTRFYEVVCNSQVNSNLNNRELLTALKSFPSHLTGIATFCSAFTAVYIHSTRWSRRVPVLLPILTQCFIILAITVPIDRVQSYYNHLSDVIVGFIIGIIFAFYMNLMMMPHYKKRMAEFNDLVTKFTLPRVSLPPTAEATNVRRLREYMNSSRPFTSETENIRYSSLS